MITALLLLAGVHVTLPVEARVTGTEIRVGDVARVTGDDAAEVARVRDVSLGYAPAPGYSRLLNAVRIATEVREKAPDIDLIFDGVGACRVWPEVEALAGTRIEEIARAELERAFAGRDVTLTTTQPPADLSLPKGQHPAELRATLSGDAHAGRVGVSVQVSVDGTPWRNVLTTWDVCEWQTCPVLTRAGQAGETIQPAMLEQRRVPVERETALQVAHLVGARLSRTVEAGQALYATDVLREVLVQAGGSVLLEVRRGNVTARVPAVAEENGSLGDEVRVHPANGTRTLRARVVARDTARVDMGATR